MNLQVSFDRDDPRKAELERIARHQNMTLDELMGRLADERLDYEVWFKAQVQKGLDSVRRGDVLSDEDVQARMDARTAELKAKHSPR